MEGSAANFSDAKDGRQDADWCFDSKRQAQAADKCIFWIGYIKAF